MKKRLITLLTATTLTMGSFVSLVPAQVQEPVVTNQRIIRAVKDASIKPAVEQKQTSSKRRATATQKKQAEYENVVMVYMVGSDLETDSEAGVSDIQEMVEAKFGDKNLVVIQTGGAKKWHSVGDQKIESRKLQRYIIENGEFKLIDTMKKDNMGKAEVLEDFIKFTKQNYSAKSTSLVLWSHGAGPAHGFGTDELFKEDALTLEELQTALKDIEKLDSIVFDACLMGNLETAYALADHAKFMLASSDFAPGDGLKYKPFLEIMKHKTMDKFTREDLESFLAGEHDTVSVVDLSKVKTLMNSVSAVIKNASTQEIFDAAVKSIAYGVLEEEDSYFDVFDLKGILNNLKKSKKSVEALEAAIIANYTSEGYENASGLSLYVPVKDDFFSVEEAAENMDDINLPKGYLEKILQLKDLVDPDVTLNVPEKAVDAMINDMNWEDMSDMDEATYEEFFGEEMEDMSEIKESDIEDFLLDQYDAYEGNTSVQAIIQYLYSVVFPEYSDYDEDLDYVDFMNE